MLWSSIMGFGRRCGLPNATTFRDRTAELIGVASPWDSCLAHGPKVARMVDPVGNEIVGGWVASRTFAMSATARLPKLHLARGHRLKLPGRVRVVGNGFEQPVRC